MADSGERTLRKMTPAVRCLSPRRAGPPCCESCDTACTSYRMREPVQSLWIGPELSVMEQLSIRSFLANGHPFHLYVYSDVRGIPDGADVRDAREILPESMIFQYSEYKTVAGFANYFRYKLLLDRGGW